MSIQFGNKLNKRADKREEGKDLLRKDLSPSSLLRRWGGLITCATSLLLALSLPAKITTAQPPLNGAPQSVLTVEEFLEAVSQNNPRFQELLYRKAALRFERDYQKIAGDLKTKIEGGYGLNLAGGDNEAALSVSLEKLFAATATKATLSYQASGGAASASAFEAAIAQPILNNAFGKKNRLHESIADLEAEIMTYQIVEAYEDYLAGVLQTYFQWYLAYSRLQNAAKIHAENYRILDEMKRRKAKNIALTVDVEKIELKALAGEADLIDLNNLFLESTRLVEAAMAAMAIQGDTTFRRVPLFPQAYLATVGGESGGEIDGQNGGEVNGKNGAQVNGKSGDQVNGKSGDQVANKKIAGRTLEMLEKIEAQAKLEGAYFEDDLLPSANAWVKYNAAGDSAPFWGGSSNQSEELTIGFTAAYPIGNTQGRAAAELARVMVRVAEAGTMNKRILLESTLANLEARIEALAQKVDLAERRLAVARRILATETSYYQRGRITLNDYIRAVNEVENLVFRIDDLKVEQASLYVEWLRLSDSLVVELP